MLAGVLVERDEPLELFCIYAIRALLFLSIFSSIPKALELLLDKEPTKSQSDTNGPNATPRFIIR